MVKATRAGTKRPTYNVECFDCGEYSSINGMKLVYRGSLAVYVHRKHPWTLPQEEK
jgi:hypothetical protein